MSKVKKSSVHASEMLDLLNFGPSNYTGGSFQHDTEDNASCESRNEYKRSNTYKIDYLPTKPESTDSGIASLLLP